MKVTAQGPKMEGSRTNAHHQQKSATLRGRQGAAFALCPQSLMLAVL